MQNYPINEMIVALAKGVAQAQFEMDRVAIQAVKDRAAQTIDNVDGSPSLLELGLTPSFMEFTETTIEMSIDISMRIEEEASISAGVSVEAESSGEKSSSMFAASLDASYGRKYGVDMSASTRIMAVITTKETPTALKEFFTQ